MNKRGWLGVLSLASLAVACSVETSDDAPTAEGSLPLIACPAGECTDPPEPPEAEPPPPEPLRPCASVCSSATGCAKACKTSTGNVSSCGAYGVCTACSATTCRNTGYCGVTCMMNNVLPPVSTLSRGGTRPPRSEWVSCSTWSARMNDDADLDGIPDALERALAAKFYPELNMHCATFEGYAGGSKDQYYGSPTGCGNVKRPNGEVGADLPYVARRVGPLPSGWCANRECIEIVYGLPYASDLGNDFGGSPHKGDTEMYAVLLAFRKPLQNYSGPEFGTTQSLDVALRDATRWAKLEEFAAAHRGDEADSSELRKNRPTLGGADFAPRLLWVAEGKQASYFSQDSCNSGNSWWSDDCSDNRCVLPRAVGVARLENSGEPLCHPASAFDTTIPSPAPAIGACGIADAYEVWSGQRYEGGSSFTDIFREGAIPWN